MNFRFPKATLASTLALLLHVPLHGHAEQSRRIDDAASASAPTDRLIVKYRDGNTAFPTMRARDALDAATRGHGVAARHERSTGQGAQVFRLSRRLSAKDAEQLARTMQAGDPNVEYAEPDRVLHPSYTPTDPLYNQQWSLFDATAGIRAPAAWDRSKGSGIVVAVVDTGVRPHADLAANLVAGMDFITDTFVSGDGTARDGDASDPGDAVTADYCGTGTPARNSSWHGTHVAGIVAGAAGNGAGIAGVAFGAKVQPLRVLGRCGGYTSDIADAVAWAAGNTVSGIAANPTPARVINLSLGGSGSCGTTMQKAINAARAKGSVVVVAAGNSASDAGGSTPANCAGVIAVAATGITGGKASYSNTGSVVSLAAPGGDSGAGILSTLNSGTTTPSKDNYVSYMGTSMATPVVSGVAALVLSVKPSLTPDGVASLLRSTATPFPAACVGCGSGIVNAGAAVAAARGTTTTAPPPPTPTPTPTTVNIQEVEPNNTIAAGQVITATSANIAGSLASTTDNDYYRVTIPAGKRLVATVQPSSKTGAGLGVYLTTGQSLILLSGSAGATRQVTVTNSGTTDVTVAVRVLLSSGAKGTYSLGLVR